MKIIGSSLFLIVLPLALIVVLLIIFIPFVLNRYRSVKIEMKEILREAKEQGSSCSKMHDIVDNFSKKARMVIKEDMGTED